MVISHKAQSQKLIHSRGHWLQSVGVQHCDFTFVFDIVTLTTKILKICEIISYRLCNLIIGMVIGEMVQNCIIMLRP